MSGLLDGIVVLDLTRFLSGPHCTLLLAGMGAEVIKVDDPAVGDPSAHAPPLANAEGVSFERRAPDDYGLAYLKRARDKKSIALDLKRAEGRALFLELVERADVVVENFRAGVADRLGIGEAVLRERNPRLVHCALTGYGSSGPDRELKAYDLMVQAATGLMSITGEPGGAPVKTGTALSDSIAGTYAALGILGALIERQRTGLGQAVDVSMADCLFSMMLDEPLDCYEALGLAARQGNRIMRFSPFNTYRALDGWVAIGAATADDWTRLLTAMGRDDLREHPRMASLSWRIEHNDEVDAVVAAWTAGLSVAQVLRALAESDVPCSPVRTPQEAIEWPHLQARGMVQPLARPDGTPTAAMAAAFPLKFSRTPAGHRAPAPVPGEHTAEVLQTLLGLSGPDLERLRTARVI